MAYVIIIRPVKLPPKLNEYATLSADAQKTLVALEQKYEKLISFLQTPVVQQQQDPANYYKSIYNASFKTSSSSLFSERGQEESAAESYSACSIKSPLKLTTENVKKFNKVSNVSRKYKQYERKDCVFLNKNNRNKPVTEVFVESGPSNEEIAESVLLMTQRTSHPDSPCMDLNDSLVDNQPFADSTYHSLFSADYSTKNIDTVCLSQSSIDFSKSVCTEKLKKQFTLSTGNDRDRLCQTTIEQYTKKNLEVVDFTFLEDEESPQILDNSDVIFSSLDPICKLKTTVNILDAKTDVMYLGTDKNVCTISRENNECEEHLPAFKTIEKADFELNLSDSEFSQICHNSQSKFNESLKDREDKFLFKSENFKYHFKEDESPIEEQRVTSKFVPEICENPFDEGNSTNVSLGLMTSKEKKIGSEHVLSHLKIPAEKKFNCENESPFMESNETRQSKQFKSCMKNSTSRQCENKISGCKLQQKIGDFFQSSKCRNDSSSKDCAAAQKRSNEQNDNSCLKKTKTSFKPPYKSKPGLSVKSKTESTKNYGEPLDTFSCSLSDVTNLSSMSSEKQKEICNSLESSQSLTLTLLYNTNMTSATTFYSAADHAKKKNTLFQHHTVGVAIIEGNSTNRCLLIPCDLMCRDDIKTTLLNILLSKKITKVIANCKEFLIGIYKMCSLYNERGMQCENLEDPVIACWLVDPENQPSSFIQMCKTAKLEYRHNDDNWVACLQFTLTLMKAFKQKLKTDKVWPVFTQIEMKLIPVLACMETCTIKVDIQLFDTFSDKLKSKIKRLKEEVYKAAGHKFSLNSHVQLRQVLYEELELDKKLPPEVKISKTDVSNQKSTCESSLNLLTVVHPLPALVLEYRQLQKLMSTYVEGMMSCVTNGSLTTHWDQTAAATGRLTSSQPNIQAVPKTVITITDLQNQYVIGSEKISNFDINAREPFISSPEHVFLAADFQQIEFRVLAHLSEDSSLQSLFNNIHGEDVFMSLTKQWHKKAPEEVTSADRDQTKRVVYSVMYGVGRDKLSEYLKVKPDIAQEIITSFLKQFPAIESFTKKCCTYTQEYGYTETVCGRRRYFPTSTASHLFIGHRLCAKQSISVCKDLQQISASLQCWQWKENFKRTLICHVDIIQQVMEDTKALCGSLFSLQVPLKVALTSGKSWAHLNPFV